MPIPSLTLLALLQAPSDPAAALVPADATVLVRFESLARLADLAAAFAELVPGGVTPAAAEFLPMLQYPGAPAAVDPAQPLYLAVSFSPEQPAPGMAWIVPLAPGAAHGIDNTEGVLSLHQEGAYLAVHARPGLARPAAPSALVAALEPGVVSVHVDLARLVEMFRPLIDMGLRQGEMELASLPQDESVPFDMEGMYEWFFDKASETVDSAQSLDLALGRAGSLLELRGRYRVKEGSPQVFRPVSTVPLATLAGHLDPQHPLQIVASGTWNDFLRPMADVLDVALEMYPEPLRSDLEQVLALQRGLDDALLPGIAASTDFTTEGMHVVYVLRAKDPARLLAGLEEMARGMDGGDGMVAIGAAERLAVEGFEGRVMPVEMRLEALQALAALGGNVDEPEPAELAEIEHAFDTLYGQNLRLALAARGEYVAIVLANNDSLIRNDLARLAKPALPAAKLLDLADQVPPGALGFVYHLDFGRTMTRLIGAMRGAFDTPVPLVFEQDFSLDTWGGALERDYVGGMRMDLAELIAFVQTMQSLEPDLPEQEWEELEEVEHEHEHEHDDGK